MSNAQTDPKTTETTCLEILREIRCMADRALIERPIEPGWGALANISQEVDACLWQVEEGDVNGFNDKMNSRHE